MTDLDLSRAVWRKSGYGGGATNCVEVAGSLPPIVAVRDSKNPTAPALTFACDAWDAFTGRVKSGKYDSKLRAPPEGTGTQGPLRAGVAAMRRNGGHGGDAAGRFPRDRYSDRECRAGL
jgi:Domain of unknown function (DUF397)